MFSFCNEQLTDGNSLTWYKCKNKTEQFKNREKGKKYEQQHTKLACYILNMSKCYEKWKNSCFKVKKIEKKTHNERMNKHSNGRIVSIVWYLAFVHHFITNSTCNK